MRIFVFRPPADAARTAAALRDRGHEPVLSPLFAVTRTTDAAPDGPFAALVLTSGNAVPALADLPAPLRDLPVFSVGARTAGKVHEAGFANSHSADGNRDDLIRLIAERLPAPARLLLIVEATGRVRRSSIRLIGKAHPAFALSAREAVLRAVYEPAQLRGRPVPQITFQDFEFKQP